MRLREYVEEPEVDEGITEVANKLMTATARSLKDGLEYAKWLARNIKNSRITKAVVRLAVNVAYRLTIGSFMETCRGSWNTVSKYIQRNSLEFEFVAIINMVFNNNYRSLEEVERDSIKLPMTITESINEAPKIIADAKAVKMFKDAMATYVPYMSAVKLTAMLVNGKYKSFEFKGKAPSNYDISLAMIWVVLINTRALRDLNIDWKYLKRKDQLYIGRKEALNIGYSPRNAPALYPDGTAAGYPMQGIDDEFDTEFVDPETGNVYGQLPDDRRGRR